MIAFISAIRTVRAEMNIPPSTKCPVLLDQASPETLARAQRWQETLSRMARVSEIAKASGEPVASAAQIILAKRPSSCR